MNKRPTVLVIVDGLGYSESPIGNAIAMAQKPNFDIFNLRYPHALLQASGESVGLKWGEAGNSEAGHLILGAGRIVRQYPETIDDTIANQTFFANRSLLETLQEVRNKKSRLHILGLLTSGSVHASFEHLLALLEMAKKVNFEHGIYLHLFTDGKDSSPTEGLSLLERLSQDIKSDSQIKIVTLSGRDFSMERTNNWIKTKEAYDLFVDGIGNKTSDLAAQLREYYRHGITDEEIPPTVLEGLPTPLINENDALIFFNFREDSMRQIIKALTEESFGFFERRKIPGLLVTTMTRYTNHPSIKVAFEPIKVPNNLAEWLSVNGLKQFHLAESEKNAHVTYFFNGMESKIYPGETDFVFESSRDPAKNPEMRAEAISERMVAELRNGAYDFYLINFANADILGHLGNLQLAVRGVKKIDESLGLIYEEVKNQNGIMIITADHGNAERLIYRQTGERETRHDPSPVPIYLLKEEFRKNYYPPFSSNQIVGILADVAPTVLELMGLPIPPEMTGRSLLPILLSE